MQSNRWCALSCSCSWPSAKKCNCCGSRLTGQASAHSPQRMQGSAGGGGGSSSSVLASRQLVVLITGTSRDGRVKPIIGPPMIRRLSLFCSSPANASSSPAGVPISASTFIGRANASPVRVVIREISGLPSSTASWMATQVPTFWQSMPMSAGRPPLGTSSPVRIWISCFSPPEGYLVGKTLSTKGRSPMAARTAAMASGLLSSMPISTSCGWIKCARISIPATSSAAFSRISRSSAVMYGSHSVPLMISVRMRCVGGGVSLTAVGKPAPPRPLIPA